MDQVQNLLVPAVVTASGLTLCSSGMLKLLDRKGFAAVLAAQGLSPLLRRMIGTILPIMELALGVVAAVVGLTGDALPRRTMAVSGFLQAALGLIMLTYILYLRHTRPGVPCGCFGVSNHRASGGVMPAVLVGSGGLLLVLVPPGHSASARLNVLLIALLAVLLVMTAAISAIEPSSRPERARAARGD